jgi:hypothetical protein
VLSINLGRMQSSADVSRRPFLRTFKSGCDARGKAKTRYRNELT